MNCTSKYFEPKPRILTISGFSNTRIWDWKSCRNLKNHQPNLAYKSPNFSLLKSLKLESGFFGASVYIYMLIILTFHIDTLLLPAIILKCVSHHNFSSLRAAWASHSLLGQLKESWETNHGRRQFLR